MCLAAKGRLQGWAAKLLLLWVGIFYFFSFQICNHVTAVSFFWLAYNGWQYDQWRIAGDFPVNSYKTLRGADAFKLPLRPTLVILLVIGWLFLLLHFLHQNLKGSVLIFVDSSFNSYNSSIASSIAILKRLFSNSSILLYFFIFL